MNAMITDEQRRWRLARRHRLIPGSRTDDIAAIADDLIGLHSSDPATVFLSAFVRMRKPSAELVHAALYRDRSVVRHHAMRRTIWVMTPDIARLAHGATTAKIAAKERRRTIGALEETTEVVDGEAWMRAAGEEIAALLNTEGPMTTRAIGQALPHLVVPMRMGATTKNPATLNAHSKVLQGAGFDGTLVRTSPTGDWTNAEYRWSPTVDWLEGGLAGGDEEQCAADLLARWLLRFGPATDTDIRWWFGWTAGLARKSLATIGAVDVELEGGDTGWLHPDDLDDLDELGGSADPGPWVRLLPGLDPTAMGWKERDWYLDPALVGELFDRFGNAGPTIWADGRIVGAWIQGADGGILTRLVDELGPEHRRLLTESIDELQAALGDVIVRPRFPAPAQRDLLAADR
ncbi:MAG: winged helix DNA-binding domain-containing protein [Actinomycetota bacterium]